MKILFVIRTVHTTEPMGIMLLSALAKREGHETLLHILDKESLTDKLKKSNPDIVAYSSMTGEHKIYSKANKIVKDYNKDIFTVMGGPHPTFFPEIVKKSNLDAVCVGEADFVWTKVLDVLKSGGDINDIPNIITSKNFDKRTVCLEKDSLKRFRIKQDFIAPRIVDLDFLPFLDYELFYDNTRFGDKFPKRTFMASRGCPFQCTYCFNRIFNEIYCGKGPIRRRYSVDRLCDEISYIKDNWPTHFIKFYDDDFCLEIDDWLLEFVEKYPKRVGLPFLCLTRADAVSRHPQMLALLKKAGMHSISMSIEAGNDYIRKNVLNRNMSREELVEAFHTAYDLDIPTFANSIFAIPVSKKEERTRNLPPALERDIESLDLNIRCKATLGEFPIFYPYPGTVLGDRCVSEGWFNGDYDKLHFSYQAESPLACFSEKEKRIQHNLALLSSVCLFFSGSRSKFLQRLTPLVRNFVVHIAIKLPLTKLYYFLYILQKDIISKRKIYPTKSSLRDICVSFFRLLRYDFFKQFAK
jgi:radical SAM superfamily enzyme YgiQ (UPF0313 family)